MKTNKIVWVTSAIGIGIILCCWLLSLILSSYVTFEILFNWVCTLLGFAANLTIVAAAVKFLTKETLDIEGYGKIRISRMQNNIQDLTNLISRDFHGGGQFSRDSLLKAFYTDVELDYIEKYDSDLLRALKGNSSYTAIIDYDSDSWPVSENSSKTVEFDRG